MTLLEESAKAQHMRLCQISAQRRFAVIDVGSSSIRLVVFAAEEAVPTVLFNEKIHCGLGRGIATSNRLHAEAMPLALDGLERFVSIAETMAVETLDLLATAAVRDATDGADFKQRAEARCGHPIRVLSGKEEARLAARGALWGAPRSAGLVGDLGGGSLELVEVGQGAIGAQATLPLGCLRVGQAGGEGKKAVRRQIDQAMETLPWLAKAADQEILAVGGAWRALAKVKLEIDHHPLHIVHGFGLGRRQIRDLTEFIADRDSATLRKQFPGVSPHRIETLPYAALLLCRLFKLSDASRVRFSSYGLREGWLWQQRKKAQRKSDPLLAFAEAWSRREERFAGLGAALIAFTKPIFGREKAKRTGLRQVVCQLSDIGWREHPDYRAQRVFERILYAPSLPGDHSVRAFIALALYHRFGGRDETQAVRQLLSDREAEDAQFLGLVLRLGHALARGSVVALGSCRLSLDAGQVDLVQDGTRATSASASAARRLVRLNRFLDTRKHLLPANTD